jgi:serine phosphatase RsbU (regulator of sigma subunit)
MEELGFETPGCNITFIDEDSDYGADYCALQNPRKYGASWNNSAVTEIDDDFIIYVREATVATVFGAEEFTVPGWRESGSLTIEIPSKVIQEVFGDLMGIEFPPELIGTGTRIGTAVYFQHGKVGFNESEYNEEHVAIMKQLVDAMALGVVRFIDFQKVEDAQQKLIDEMEEELQTAHDMQMNLMPTDPPKIEGFDIAGRCLTANHVGGDFFQYFPQGDRLSLTLADVTGHAMEAAIPAVMFSGILDNQMEIGGTLEELFTRLNRSMHRNLDDRTFVCFTAAELDLNALTARLANGGCPYPYHYRAATNDIAELQVEAYPLGVQAASSYPVIEVPLSPGDRLVLCSDGIVEATDPDDQLFGFERTAAAIQEGCRQDLSAEQLIEFVFTRLGEFTGDAPRGDDQTVVVLGVEA